MQAWVNLAGCLLTTVVSPDEREAVLAFQVGGACRIYLNGRQIGEWIEDEEKDMLPVVDLAYK